MAGKKIDKDSSKSNDRLEEIKDDIKTIGTRSTWMLGVLVIVILGTANLLTEDLGLQIGSLTWTIVQSAKVLCVLYLVILLAYIPLLIMPNFGKPIYEDIEENELKQNIKLNDEILERLKKRFKSLIYLLVSLVPVHLIGAWIWYLVF